MVVILGLVHPVTASPAKPTPKRQLPPEIGKSVDFAPLRARLMQATKATVSPACGSVMWPWAYRGKLSTDRTLRAYRNTQVAAPWVGEFVTLLFHSADWDSVEKFRGVSKPCDQSHDVPLFGLTFEAKGGDVYALLSLETRCAQIFEADRPLGTLWFRDRADSLLGLLRSALASDSVVASMALPDTVPLSSSEGISSWSWVEVLPDVVTKVPPRYPNEAVLANKSGTVWIQALVGPDGAVHDAYVRKQLRPLDDAALEAVRQWKFKPAMSGGFPIAVWVSVPVRFALE